VRAGARSLDNGLVALTVGRDGTVTLADRRTGLLYPALLGLESSGDVGDTYSYAPPPRDRVRRVRGPASVRVLARGPLVATLEVRSTLACASGQVAARLLLTLHAHSAVLRCTAELDNRATDHRLRLRVPSGVPGVPAIAGGPFGPVTRQALVADAVRYPRETPVTTAPAQRYVAVASGDRGLALLAPGFFEYELAADGDLRMTLLRCVGQLSRADLSTRPGHAGWPTPTPEAQCPGADRLQLAVVPVGAADLQAGNALPELWEDVFLPPRALWLRQATSLRPPDLDVRLEGDGLVLSAVKPAAAGGLVLRCYNARAEPVEGHWRLGWGATRAEVVRADERGARMLTLADGGRSIPFRAGPRAIVTVLVDGPP
jgi:mannosylglycerate hydrolase